MKIIESRRSVALTIAFTAAMGSSACSSPDLAGNDLQTVSLSFTARESSGLAAVFDGRPTSVSSTAAVPAVSRIQLVLTKMQLGRTDDIACVSEGDDDDIEHTSSTPSGDRGHSCVHVTRDPVLINMPVDGTLKTQLSVPLAAGTYRKLEAKLEPVNPRKTTGAAFLAANPDFKDISIRVDGTFNGSPFIYRSNLRAAIQMRFNPALVIDATTKNATINVDVSKWFVAGSGEVIDPTKAVPGSHGARLVEKNIRASFRAFKDNEKRGKDHH